MFETDERTRLLTRVEKPGRYVGGEWNEIRKDPARVRTKVALAFPDVYEIGMSYLGQKILYGLLNRARDVLAERVFAPWPDLERELRASRQPLTSLENGLPLRAFDIVGFSLLYELNYTNVLTILDLGGIPLLSADRGEEAPLVIAGGPAAFNPEPVADIFDLIFLGDGEEGFPEIVRETADLRRRGLPRRERLRRLARIEGVYVPSFYRAVPTEGSPLLVPEPLDGAAPVIRKRQVKDFARSFFPEKIIVPGLRVVFDRVAIEAARGCPQSCRFCQATTLYFPHRPKDAAVIHRTALRSLRQTGYEDLSLSALSVGDHPQLEPLVRALMDELAGAKISLSLSSLRPGRLSRELVESILKVRKTGFTLVPEAGTDRLRAVIGKALDAAEIRDALTFAFEGGWQLIKLYVMIGLPTETEEDLAGIAALVRDALDLGRSILRATPRIHVSVSSFIPKPHTPFQWLGMDDESTLAAKQAFVRGELRRFRTVEVKAHAIPTSVLEAVFSRGDRRLGPVLIEAWRRGARFDAWDDKLDQQAWNDAFAAVGIDRRDYLRPLPREAVLPWDHIDTRVKKTRLLQELDAALRAERTPDCLDRSCPECGGCDERAWRKPAPPAKMAPPPTVPVAAGEPAGALLRYRAIYAKRGKARYLSHIDLIHILQRSFRRAGIEVRKTQGFHPKMEFAYGPALPLGMEALKEVLEFRSERKISEADFLRRMNKSTPAGIRFSQLRLIEPGAPSLYKAMDRLVYSLDRTGATPGPRRSAREIRTALERFKIEHEARALDFRFAGRRLFLTLPPDPAKGARAQDIVHEVLGIEEPSFLIRRDAVSLKN
jgi:radical SAM family uncharacterized protein/radical SAM-linked protein